MFGNVARHAQVFGKFRRGNSSTSAETESSSSEVIRLEPVGKNLPEKRSKSAEIFSTYYSQIYDSAASAGPVVNEQTALGVSAVLACQRLISDMVAKLPIELIVDTENGPKIVKNSQSAFLIGKYPSDLHTDFELKKLIMTGKCLGGNGYARVYRDSIGNPISIQYIEPYRVAPQIYEFPDGQRFVKYLIDGSISIERRDMIHVRGETRDGVNGISPIQLLRESIGTSLSQTEAAGRMMKNGARFPGVMKVEGNLKPEQLSAIRDEVNNNMTGAINAGRIPVVNGSMSFMQTSGMTMVDAQFIESRRFELQEICRHFGVQPFLVGDSTASTTWGTGIQEMTLGFLNFCLDPHLLAFEKALNFTLLTPLEKRKGYYFKFDRDELASVSRQDTAAYFQTMRNIGVYSANDIRRKLDETIIAPEDGGDDYGRPFNASGGTPKTQEKPTQEPVTP